MRNAVNWNDTVSVELALSLLGYSALPEGLTASAARARATGAWDANERERFVAYRSLAAHLDTIPTLRCGACARIGTNDTSVRAHSPSCQRKP